MYTQQILKSIEPWKEIWRIMQTLPRVNEKSVAALIKEIGDDMGKFGGMKEIAS